MSCRHHRASCSGASRLRGVVAAAALAAIAHLVAPSAPSFASLAVGRAAGSAKAGVFCGGSPIVRDNSLISGMASTATATAPLGWLNPRSWSSEPLSPTERLSPREWTRMYRNLGLEEGASREKTVKATTRLRRKYADDEEALERVENANLWIMTKMMMQKEEATRKRQQANRMRELGNAPKNLFLKYIGGYLPPSVRQMFEAPSSAHFRTASSLMGIFALMGVCVPTQAMNFVGLSGVACMGLIYQRGRPEPVKDDMGNAGAVQKINYKEAASAVVITALGVLSGLGLANALSYVVDAQVTAVFCLTACATLWTLSLFMKVYGCFNTN